MGTGLLLVYFVYGLAFWAMGLAVLLESGRAASTDQARSLHWLSAFGILHGTHEWLEAYLLAARSLGAPLPAWLDWFRLGLLTTSFGCLYAYALTALRLTRIPSGRRNWQYSLPILASLYLLVAVGSAYRNAPVQWPPVLDAASRYVLAVPSAVLAAVALSAAARADDSRNRPAISANLRLAAGGFAVYALAQVFVHRLPWFPASLVNQETFLSLTGVPIQAVRAVMAALISIGLLRAMQAAEQERQSQLDAAHQERLAALEQQDALRRDLLRHVVRSQEDERARIARELHDQVAQLLSAFSLQLGSLRLKLKRADTTEMLDRLQELTRQMSESLYHLVRDLRPSHLDNLGLVPALKFLLSQEYGPKGLDVTFHVTGHAKPLRGLIDTALFRIAQESLTNVVRHAHVNRAVVDVQYDRDRVTLRICDEGRGFDAAEHFHPPRGWGLAGMRERVESLAGQLSLRSAPSQGTTVEVVVPLDPGKQEESGDE
ncbi:MAG: sensor histidine kinase [Chloroflexota bacterium]